MGTPPRSSTDHYPSGVLPSSEAVVETLACALASVTSEGLDHLVVGGISTFVLGRPRSTHDIDLLVRPDDVERASSALTDAGFETWIHDPGWLMKATRCDVLVDVVWRSAGDLYLDDDMLAAAVRTHYKGVELTSIGPEDLIVMKALSVTEECAHHWYDALAVLAHQELDWDYLLRRAAIAGPRRVLALLHFATSSDLVVPDHVLDRLESAFRNWCPHDGS